MPTALMDSTLPPFVLVAGAQLLLYALAWALGAALLREQRRAVVHWGGFMLTMAAACLLVGLRGAAGGPHHLHGLQDVFIWLVHPGADLLLLAAWLLLRRGHELFMHQRPADREHLAWIALAAGGLLLLGPGAENARWRALLLCAASAAIALRGLLRLAPKVRAEYGRWPSLLIALPAGLVLAGALLRGLQLLLLESGRPLERVVTGLGSAELMLGGLVAAAAFNISPLTMLTLRLTRRLQAAALQDSLTGLPNRRVIDARLRQEWRRWCRHTSAFTVLALELDQFRRINEFWGHPAGDEMLEQIGQRLQAGLREVDTVARTGGKEFLLLLPDTELAAALVAAERLRAGLADEPYRVRAQSLQITASLGLAQVRGGDADVESLLARAQAALRRAKAEGGNRVCSSAAQGAPAAGG